MNNKYALLTNAQGEWDYYPDPLRDTKQAVQEKINYLVGRYGGKMSGYKIKKLNKEEIKEHTCQWKKWCSMID